MIHTFLFTDIESSTRLWEEHPSEMQSALARHDSILDAAVTAANGRVLKTTGDGMIAIFDTPRDAIAACIQGQSQITSQRWETTDPVRVRMGMHTGDAEERDDDYFGPTLNRTARIMAAAHGGQVLLSDSAATQVRSGLTGATTLRDLGTHRLKDLTTPEHLYQLVSSNIPSEFPPPKTLDSTPNNLPFQTAEFFGRERELAAVGELLDDPAIRLITLLGPGGTGKTRLVIQTAAEHVDRFEHGVFFVDLSAEREAEGAFEAVVRALDVPVGAEGDSLTALQTRLRDRELLLVLDNFEQVTVAAPGVVEILESCPRLQILVTSREALRVRPERIYQVPPMGLPDQDATPTEIAGAEAVRLFVERARAIRPDFVLGDEEAITVAAICVRLDGLPLAIELAAARLNIFSPGDLLGRITERMDVLATRSRDRPERQQTLWGAIGWSYDLLDDADRRVFTLMSVFSTASLEALEEVSAAVIPGVDVIESLASLVDQSLIRSQDVTGTRRFSMLQTVREYAFDRLVADPDLATRVEEAHAIYYSEYTRSLADLLAGPERLDTLDRMSLELGNLRAAWKHWVEEGALERLFAQLDGLWALNDARGWYHAALELARDMLGVLAESDDTLDHADEELALRVSLARAMMAIRGFSPEVEVEFQRALELAEGNASNQVPVLRALSTYYIMTVQLDKAADSARRIIEIAETEENQSMAIEGHLMYGAALLDKVELALEHLDRAIELYDPTNVGASRFRLGSSPGVVARVAAGITRWRMGQFHRGVELVEEAVGLARQLDHPFSLSYALYHAGYLHTLRTRFDLSLNCARELQEVAHDHDYQIWEALSKVIEGVSLVGSGDAAEGLTLSETGVELYQGLTTPPVFWPLILSLRSSAHLGAGKPERALALIDEAITMMGDGSLYPEFGVLRGDILAAMPDSRLDESAAAYRQAGTGARRLELRGVELQALTHLVPLLSKGGGVNETTQLEVVFQQIEDGSEEVEMNAARHLLGLSE
ncbi:MAG: adenylate/guanylate cyclase domain-containing protein [Acidimicrobiia bacterium]